MQPTASPSAIRHGTVYLVGAGPGSADLITVRGWRLLQQADVIVYDSLADESLRTGLRAELIDAGKRRGHHGRTQSEINALLVELAQAGKAVVRLKGGDPFVLGRGSEEAMALAAAGVPCEVVPGVSSAIAAPELAGVPVTHRGVADAFCVLSAHLSELTGMPTIPPYQPRLTLVVLMGVARLAEWWPQLQHLGYPEDLPVAWVTWAARPEQGVLTTTVGRCLTDAARADLQAPSVAIVGRVVAMRAAVLGEPGADLADMAVE
jgi:uroporphyrin-III C-methyltransferase